VFSVPLSKLSAESQKAAKLEQMNGATKEEKIRRIADKMEKIIFPTVSFQGASVAEALEYLRVKSRDEDNISTEGARGVNITLREGAPSNASLSLDLKNVPMVETLRYIVELAQMKYRIEEDRVLVVPLMSN